MKTACIVAPPKVAPKAPAVTWGSAFADGLRRHGWRVTLDPTPRPADMLVLWGVGNSFAINQQRAAGGTVAILERGYLGDRHQWTSVSFGGRLNGHAKFGGDLADPSRFETHFAHLMKSWRAPAGYALILGQVATDNACKHINMQRFYDEARETFAAMGYTTKFRPHPLASRVPGVVVNRPIAEDLAGAGIAVTMNSNSGVDAVLAGVPTIALDRGSMAWDVTGHDLVPPPTPDRAAWAAALAWKQWRMSEIADGTCWAHIGEQVHA